MAHPPIPSSPLYNTLVNFLAPLAGLGVLFAVVRFYVRSLIEHHMTAHDKVIDIGLATRFKSQDTELSARYKAQDEKIERALEKGFLMQEAVIHRILTGKFRPELKQTVLEAMETANEKNERKFMRSDLAEVKLEGIAENIAKSIEGLEKRFDLLQEKVDDHKTTIDKLVSTLNRAS